MAEIGILPRINSFTKNCNCDVLRSIAKNKSSLLKVWSLKHYSRERKDLDEAEQVNKTSAEVVAMTPRTREWFSLLKMVLCLRLSGIGRL